MKSPLGSLQSLKAANNILFGCSMLSGATLLVMAMIESSPGKERLTVQVAEYSWLGFLTLWVVSMLASFVCSIFKLEGQVLAWFLRVSCAAGVIHLACVPWMFFG